MLFGQKLNGGFTTFSPNAAEIPQETGAENPPAFGFWF